MEAQGRTCAASKSTCGEMTCTAQDNYLPLAIPPAFRVPSLLPSPLPFPPPPTPLAHSAPFTPNSPSPPPLSPFAPPVFLLSQEEIAALYREFRHPSHRLPLHSPTPTLPPSPSSRPPVSQEEIAALYRRFCALDRNGKGYVSGDEFLSIPEFAINPLAHRLLGMLEGVNFKDFVKWLAAFSSRATAEDRTRLVFAVYDVDGDGRISKGDVLAMLQDLSGGFLSDQQRQEVVVQAMQQAGFSSDSLLSFTDVYKVIGKQLRLQLDIPVDE
ncbi:unnamed protein product [Closterium sp. NIES-65]|nr:unnamed protein product [Closterium sp. NIES-65]